MRAIGVEEASAVGSQFLDHFLRSGGAKRNCLFFDDLRRRFPAGVGCLHGLGIYHLSRCIRLEILRHTLPDQEKRTQNAYRHEHPERRPRHVHPEIAEGILFAPRDSANDGDGQSDSDRRRNKIVVGETRHLRQVGHRRFRHVGLPVGVGRKGCGGVEGQVGRHGGELLRIQREIILQPLQEIQHRHRDAAEHQHRAGIFGPAHLFGFINAGQPVHQLFNGSQDGVEDSFFAVEYARHERAQRFREREHHQQEEENLEPSVVCHGQNFSGRSIAYTR